MDPRGNDRKTCFFIFHKFIKPELKNAEPLNRNRDVQMKNNLIKNLSYLLPLHVSTRVFFPGKLKYGVVLCVIFLAGIIYPCFQAAAGKPNSEKVIEGIVLDNKDPVSRAVVRIQTTEYSTVTGPDGKFKLAYPDSLSDPVKLTAWAKGYYICGPVEALPGSSDVIISINRHGRWDNREYEWLPSLQSDGSGENQGCAECHFQGEGDSGPMLPVDQWLKDAHSQSAVNPIFLTLYTGNNSSGNRSQSTRYRYTAEGELYKLPPDPEEPYYGPGYRLDSPNNPGNCGACHLPTAAVNAPLNTDPAYIQGTGFEGVSCDFCHKIWDVNLDPDTGLPFPDKPGVLSYEFRRPFEGHQFFAGPLDDIAPGEDTYSRLQKESQYCAPCHFGVFKGSVIYDSFGEWLRSPYSKEETGKTCQDCHMPATGATFFAHPEKGGLKRNPDTITSHRMPGARDTKLLQNSVSMNLEAEQSSEGIRVITRVVNDQTGHHVPTDSPLRHLILIVRAYDSDDSELSLKEGPVLPEWCGIGNHAEGCYAGLPGKVFIKLLEEKWTGISPTAAYWNPTRVVMDTRLGAFESDVGEFIFMAPDSKEVRIEAVLLYRRIYKELMELKGLDEPDIVMETATVLLSQK